VLAVQLPQIVAANEYWIENRLRRALVSKARRRAINMLIRMEVMRGKNYI
jgi:hypothetical protein